MPRYFLYDATGRYRFAVDSEMVANRYVNRLEGWTYEIVW